MNIQNLLFIDSEIDDLQSIIQMVNHNTISLIVTCIDNEYTIISESENIDIISNKVGIISNKVNFINYYKNLYTNYSSDNNDFFDWVFNYDNNVFTNNYGLKIETSIPNITKLGGVFEIINNNNISFNINQENGQIIFLVEQVGIYDVNILYRYNTLEFLCKIQIILKPVIEYNLDEFKTLIYLDEFVSSLPIIKPYNNYNNFSINSNDHIIDKNTGQIKINKLSVGTHLIYINYELNNVKIEIPINIYVKSFLQ